MTGNPFLQEVVWQVGPVPITRPVVTTWALMAVLGVTGAWAARSAGTGRAGTTVEWLLDVLGEEMRATMQTEPAPFLPIIGTLFAYILLANLSGLLPGVEPPTGALETDLALALSVWIVVIAAGVSRQGVVGYLKSFAKPNIFMLPLNLMEAVTRVLSMSIRLFGNVMSGMFISAVVLTLAGLLVPIPFMALEILTGVLQAYIFAVLAMVFIAGAMSEEG